jgi:tRNA nucleotidyltransferase (CCA-adding enzyme)
MSAVTRNIDYSLVPSAVVSVCERLEQAGYQAFVVGGSVRDLLIGRQVGDWDITTSARPQQVRALFRKTIPTGLQHGTVTVLLDDQAFEVTTFRGDGDYSDGRRPDSVAFVDELELDLQRRDFTVNAIALDPVARVLKDPLGGVADLERRLIRAVGEPLERMHEDGLRAMRAVRFATVLGFDVDPPTLAAIPRVLDRFSQVSMERVRDELLKLLGTKLRPSVGIELMREAELLPIVLPELIPMIGLAQNGHHQEDVYRHTLSVLDAVRADPILRLAALLHDVAKPETATPREDDPTQNRFIDHERKGGELSFEICQRLKLSNQQRDKVVHLVRYHLFGQDESISKAGVRRFVRRVGRESLDELFELRRADLVCRPEAGSRLDRLAAFRKRVDDVLEEPPLGSVRDLAIDGNDLKEQLGKPAGRWIGETLRTLLEEVTEDPALNERETLLARARQLLDS